MSEKKMYRIRNQDGRYSNGGRFPRFTGKGKIWTTLGGLKSHLNLTYKSYPTDVVVEETLLTIGGEYPVSELYKEIVAKREFKEETRRQRMLELSVKRDLAELERLQNKYQSTL